MRCAIFVLLMTVLCWTEESYSTKVSVQEIFASTTLPPLFFNNRNYIEALATKVAENVTTEVMLVVGPKDSGKSTAIALVSEFWKTKGHVVIDINLKGLPHRLHGKDIMPVISSILIHNLSLLPFISYKDIWSILSYQCRMDNSITVVLMIIEWLVNNHNLVYATYTALLAVVLAMSRNFKSWWFIILIALLSIICMISFPILYYAQYNPFGIVELLEPLNKEI